MLFKDVFERKTAICRSEDFNLINLIVCKAIGLAVHCLLKSFGKANET